MKKLIAIAVVFVLAVGVAFAADVGAEVLSRVDVLTGDTADEDSKVQAGGFAGRIRVYASGENDDGNFGGWFRFEANPQNSGSADLHGYAWWKPLDVFKLTIGTNPDRFNGKDGIMRWSYYQVPSDIGVTPEAWNFNQSFYGGFGGIGAILTLTPIEPLQINVMIPFVSKAGEAKDVYQQLHAQISYNLGSIGNLAVTYRGGLNTRYEWFSVGGTNWDESNSKLFVYFGLTAIENLGIDLGVGYTLPVDYLDAPGGAKIGTRNDPVALGLGVNFSAGALGIKARVEAVLGGKATITGVGTAKDDTVIVADLMPFFAVTDKVTAHLSTGLNITKHEDDGTGDLISQIGWHIQPYVTVKANWWAPNFYAGFRIASDGSSSSATPAIVQWSVPVGIGFAF